MPFCMNCGKELNGGKFCPECGMPVDGKAVPGRWKKGRPEANGLRAWDLILKALNVLKQKPVRLWGVSLLCMLLVTLAAVFGVLPILSVPIALVLNAGMAAVFLAGYRGGEVNADALFLGFKNFFHVAGGMGWMALWVFIWGLIPVVGPVFAVIKAYSYRFVPYILMHEPEIPVTEALRVSMRKTEGFKGRMFLADFLVSLACALVIAILYLLSTVRYVGIAFLVILALALIFFGLVVPLLMGLISAAGYEEIYVKEGKGEVAAEE